MLFESSIRGGTGGLDANNLTCSRTDFTTAAGNTLREQVAVEHEEAVVMMNDASRMLLGLDSIQL